MSGILDIYWDLQGTLSPRQCLERHCPCLSSSPCFSLGLHCWPILVSDWHLGFLKASEGNFLHQGYGALPCGMFQYKMFLKISKWSSAKEIKIWLALLIKLVVLQCCMLILTMGYTSVKGIRENFTMVYLNNLWSSNEPQSNKSFCQWCVHLYISPS